MLIYHLNLINVLIGYRESQTRLAEGKAYQTVFQPEYRTMKLISCQVILWYNYHYCYSLLYLHVIIREYVTRESRFMIL